MTRVEAWQPAADDERFAPGAFDGSIGKRIPWTYEGSRIGTATVVNAVVADDGSGVTLTLDLD